MIDGLMQELSTRKKGRAANFAQTARRLSEGEKISAKAVEETLLATGKSPEELRDAVELATRRATWRAELKAAEHLDKERETVSRLIEQAQTKFDKAEEQFKASCWPLDDRNIAAQGIQATADAAEKHLRSNCPDDIREAVAQNTQSRREIGGRVAALREGSRRVEAAASDLKQANAFGHDSPKGRRWLEKSKANKQAGEQALAELGAVEEELVAAELRGAELDSEMLTA